MNFTATGSAQTDTYIMVGSIKCVPKDTSSIATIDISCYQIQVQGKVDSLVDGVIRVSDCTIVACNPE